MSYTDFIQDRKLYEKVILEQIPAAQRFIWIGTSDIKNMHVGQSNKMIPLLEVLSRLIHDGVSIRLIHAKEPGPSFREDFDRFSNLIDGIERLLCPRIHFKSIIIDSKFAYTGSANLTGAGLGAKSPDKRNFEAGIITTDSGLINKIMEQFDNVWMGNHCYSCKRRDYCSEHDQMIAKL